MRRHLQRLLALPGWLFRTSAAAIVVGILAAYTCLGESDREQAKEVSEINDAVATLTARYDRPQLVLPGTIVGLVEAAAEAAEAGRYEESLTLLQEASTLTKSPVEVAQVAFDLAFAFINIDKPDEAAKQFLIAEEVSTTAPDRSLRAIILGEHGNFLKSTGDFEAAEARYNEALAIFRVHGDKVGEAATLFNLGHMKRLGGDVEESRELLDEALALNIEIGRYVGQVLVWIERAIQHRYIFGSDSAAQNAYQTAYDIAHSNNDDVIILHAAYGLGLTLRDQENHQEALGFFLEALQSAQKRNQRLQEVNLLYHVGVEYERLDLYEDAELYHAEGRQLARALGSEWHEAWALYELSRLAGFREDDAAKESHLEEALPIARSGSNPVVELLALHDLGLFRVNTEPQAGVDMICESISRARPEYAWASSLLSLKLALAYVAIPTIVYEAGLNMPSDCHLDESIATIEMP